MVQEERAFAAGAGIAVPHLTRGGMSATTAWGTVALLAGLALLAVGTHTLAVRLRWWGRVPVTVAVLAATAVVLLSLEEEQGSQEPEEQGHARPPGIVGKHAQQ